MMKKLITKVMMLFMALGVVFAMAPQPAYAANNVTVTKTIKSMTNMGQAKRIRWTTNRVTFKYGTGCVAFRATKNKWYTIKVYNITSAYKGKKSQTSNIANFCYNKSGKRFTNKKLTKKFVGATATYKVYLKKGQRIAFAFTGHTNFSGSYVKTAVTFKVS